MLIIYGIKNCDSMKKAFNWLNERNINYRFHNYKTDGVSPELIQSLIAYLGWEAILNTKGLTWRKLDDETKKQIDNEQAAKEIMLKNPSIIKRPILIKDEKKALVGFNEKQYQQFFE